MQKLEPLYRIINSTTGKYLISSLMTLYSTKMHTFAYKGHYGEVGGCNLKAIAIVGRFKLKKIYGALAGTKKVAIVERWPIVQL